MGGWREGDPVADRRFADLGPVTRQLGDVLPAVRIAYETWGVPRRDDAGRVVNAVLVEHALTGDAHVAGAAGPGQPTPGWWPDLIGPDRPLDPGRWYVVASNVLGGCQGSTGPGSPAPDGRPWGSRFGPITVGDQVTVEALLADALGIDAFVAVLGGSMGGMRSLEWAVSRPGRVGAALVLAVGAAATADQIGTQTAQVLAVTGDPAWAGGDFDRAGPGPVDGLGLARRLAHLTYRTAVELETRFGRRPQEDGNPGGTGAFAVQSYLDHQARKLVDRFDAGSYVVLTDAMTGWDVGYGRGGVAAALAGCEVPAVVAGIDSDRLYPLRLQEEIADLLPAVDGLHTVVSPYGHDGFLLEADQVAALVDRTLEISDVRRRTSRPG